MRSPSSRVARNPVFSSCTFIFIFFKVNYVEKLVFLKTLKYIYYLMTNRLDSTRDNLEEKTTMHGISKRWFHHFLPFFFFFLSWGLSHKGSGRMIIKYGITLKCWTAIEKLTFLDLDSYLDSSLNKLFC